MSYRTTFSRFTFWHHYRHYPFIFWGLLAFGIKQSCPPELIEQYYSRGLYLLIRQLLDNLVGALEFSLMPIWYLGLGLHIAYNLFQYVRSWYRGEHSPLRLAYRGIMGTLDLIGFIACWFWIFWGYNYTRLPLEQQLELHPTPLDSLSINVQLADCISTCDSLRRLVPDHERHFSNYHALQDSMRILLKRSLHANNYPNSGDVRCIAMSSGTLLKLEISGIYFPFVGQGHYDAGLHDLEKPFTIAHELAHGYGITGEGDCNFLAWLSCRASNSPLIAYSAELERLAYLLSECRQVQPYGFRQWRERIPEIVKADRREIAANAERYPPYIEDLSPRINHIYLRSQGIGEGVLSYERLSTLIAAWQSTQGISPRVLSDSK